MNTVEVGTLGCEVWKVAFLTAEARQQSGAESWDEDEYYWAADETLTA